MIFFNFKMAGQTGLRIPTANTIYAHCLKDEKTSTIYNKATI